MPLQNTITCVENNPALLPNKVVYRKNEVLLKVLCTGLCKTDILAANGVIETTNGRVLGHECVAEIVPIENANLPTQRIILWPYLPCKNCKACMRNSGKQCSSPLQFGIDRDGCFSEYLMAPRQNCIPIPPALSLKKAAYVEPLASALGILDLNINTNDSILILGINRRTELCLRVLKHAGYLDVQRRENPLPNTSFSVILDGRSTRKDPTQALKLGGTLYELRRGPFQIAERDSIGALKIPMGQPEMAIALLCDPQFDIDDLLGPVYSLSEFISCFSKDDGPKLFCNPWLD